MGQVAGEANSADLALLGADPTALDGAELAAVPVLGTWLAGVQVFGG